MVWPQYDVNVSFDSYPIKNVGKLESSYSSQGVTQSDIKTIPRTTSKGLYVDRLRNMYTNFNVNLGYSYNIKSYPWILSTDVYIPMITYETNSISYGIVEIHNGSKSVGISVRQDGSALCMGFFYPPTKGLNKVQICVCPIIVDRLVHIDLIHNPISLQNDNFVYVIDRKERYEFNVNMDNISNNNSITFSSPEYDYFGDRVYMYINNMRFRFI